jgi:hypothetical protein
MSTLTLTPETEERSIALPVQTRALALQPETWNDEDRTVEVIWSTGAKVVRYDWMSGSRYWEELSMDPAHVSLARLNGGAQVLNSHQAYELENVIGVVVPGSARIEQGQGRATLRLSERPELAGLVQDIAAGIIRNVSIGYQVTRYQETRSEGEIPTYLAIEWEPFEISFVGVPADAGAQARSKEFPAGEAGEETRQGGVPCIISRAIVRETEAPANQEVRMSNSNDLPGGEALGLEKVTAPVAEARTVSAKRVRELGARLGGDAAADLLEAHSETPFTEERLMAEIGRRHLSLDTAPMQSGGGRVLVDEREKHRAAATEALVHRGTGSRAALKEGGEIFRGRSMVEIGCEMAGINTRGLVRAEMVEQLLARSTHVSSDFPLVLAAASNKFLRDAYEAAPRTFAPFVRPRTVADFKAISVTALGDAPALLSIPQGGEVKWGTVGEDAQVYALATYGRAVNLSRQMLVNDDLDAFSRLPVMFGRRAASLESDLVYTSILMGNPAMRTGGALFQTGAVRGANLAASGTTIDITTIGAGEAVMMNQLGIGPDGTATGGDRLNIRPSFLVTGTARSVLARQMTSAQMVPSASASINPFAGQLQPIVDARITGNAWFLIANPGDVDTIELAYLEGQTGPMISEHTTISHDGIGLRALFDVGAAAIDYRGLYRNPGA